MFAFRCVLSNVLLSSFLSFLFLLFFSFSFLAALALSETARLAELSKVPPLNVPSPDFSTNSPKFILYALRTYCLAKPARQFKDLFTQYDKNSDGSLDVHEIMRGIRTLGFDADLEAATAVLTMMDFSGNQALDFGEFRAAILDERIAHDFEGHTRKMHNDCRLQEEYRDRCLKNPVPAALIGQAALPNPTAGHVHHEKGGRKQREGGGGDVAAETEREGAENQGRSMSQKKNLSEQLKNLKAAFMATDVDGSGFLDAKEMELLCFEHNLPLSWTVPLMKDADVDGDGLISYTEFVGALVRKSQMGDHDAWEKQEQEEDFLAAHDGAYGQAKDLGDEGFKAHIFGEVLGNFKFREGPPVTHALPTAGGWKLPTRVNHSNEPLLYSAHASHMTTCGVKEDGVSALMVRPLSYHVKVAAPNFFH